MEAHVDHDRKTEMETNISRGNLLLFSLRQTDSPLERVFLVLT